MLDIVNLSKVISLFQIFFQIWYILNNDIFKSSKAFPGDTKNITIIKYILPNINLLIK